MSGASVRPLTEDPAGSDAVDVRARAWQGMLATALWVVLTLGVWPFSLPIWLAIWYPLPILLLAADALGPTPLFVRLRLRPTWRPLVIVQAVILAMAVLAGLSAIASPGPRSDQPLTLTCAARDILRARDPYATYEPQCLKQLGYSGVSVTPLHAGPFANDPRGPSNTVLAAVLKTEEADNTHAGFPAFGYPPEAILTLVPVAFDGWRAIAIWIVALSALLLAAIYLPRPRVPPVVVVWQLAALAMIWLVFGWNPELIGYLLLAASFALIHLRRLGSLLLGLAVLTTPMAWIVAPIHVAITWHEDRRWQRAGWLLGTLVVGFVPWWMWDHHLPVELWRFISLPTFPTGAALGLLVFSHSDLRPLLTLSLLLVVMACAWTALKYPSWRWGMAALVWAAFLVSWRAPLYYYDAAFWLSPAVLAGWYRYSNAHPQSPASIAPEH